MLWAQSIVFYLLTFTVLTETCPSSPAFALSYYVFFALCVSPYRGFIRHQGWVHASCVAWAWHQPLGPSEGRSRHASSGQAVDPPESGPRSTCEPEQGAVRSALGAALACWACWRHVAGEGFGRRSRVFTAWPFGAWCWPSRPVRPGDGIWAMLLAMGNEQKLLVKDHQSSFLAHDV